VRPVHTAGHRRTWACRTTQAPARRTSAAPAIQGPHGLSTLGAEPAGGEFRSGGERSHGPDRATVSVVTTTHGWTCDDGPSGAGQPASRVVIGPRAPNGRRRATPSPLGAQRAPPPGARRRPLPSQRPPRPPARRSTRPTPPGPATSQNVMLFQRFVRALAGVALLVGAVACTDSSIVGPAAPGRAAPAAVPLGEFSAADGGELLESAAAPGLCMAVGGPSRATCARCSPRAPTSRPALGRRGGAGERPRARCSTARTASTTGARACAPATRSARGRASRTRRRRRGPSPRPARCACRTASAPASTARLPTARR
jgi:hypothetical protein